MDLRLPCDGNLPDILVPTTRPVQGMRGKTHTGRAGAAGYWRHASAARDHCCSAGRHRRPDGRRRIPADRRGCGRRGPVRHPADPDRNLVAARDGEYRQEDRRPGRPRIAARSATDRRPGGAARQRMVGDRRRPAPRFSPCLPAVFLPNAARHSLRICPMAWVRCRRCPTVPHRHQSRYPAPGHSGFRRRQPARRSEYPLLRITACHIIATAPLLLALVVAGPGSGRTGCSRSPAGQGRPRNLFTWPATSAAASATVPCRDAVVRADHRR